MNWLAPQSRFVLKTFFKRNYDYLNSGAQKLINWIMLATDVVLLYTLLGKFFLNFPDPFEPT